MQMHRARKRLDPKRQDLNLMVRVIRAPRIRVRAGKVQHKTLAGMANQRPEQTTVDMAMAAIMVRTTTTTTATTTAIKTRN
jgi:hypothetical protein